MTFLKKIRKNTKNNWEKKRKAVEVTSNGTHTYYT